MYKKTFENLFIWNESKDLFINFYKKFNDWKFNNYFFRDQILRATLSISNNIAEWYEKRSAKELSRFLFIAKWSTWEVRNMLIVWKELWYFEDSQFEECLKTLNQISSWIFWLIKKIYSKKENEQTKALA